MKSKVKFDLNASNEAVITAEIVFTDDVRDKVARTFHEGLGYDSNLAYVNIHPHLEMPGLVNINGKEVDGMIIVKRLQIKTFGASPTETLELCRNLCTCQLESLLKNIPIELTRRKKSQKVLKNI